MSVRIVEWNPEGQNRVVKRFFGRPAFDPEAEQAAAGILADVDLRGAAAVVDYARQFDGADLKASQLRVSQQDIDAAAKQVDAGFKRAARETRKRVRAFAKAGMKRNWSMKSPGGGSIGEQFVPFDRVGVYVPGGKAPLVSTAMMTAAIAQAAGVPEIVGCTPCGPDGKVNPYLLFAMSLAGCTEIYRVGGVQAIGLMAYGVRGIDPVQKIVGPGNAYVTAAKRQVYGRVALDLVAGPSEIAVLADESANPAYVAADLLSQAEHGTGEEKALLVATSRGIADAVVAELDRQAGELPREAAVRRVMKQGALIVVAPDLDVGMELCNDFAPEHFELLVREPKRWLKRVRCAGAVFVGPWTPESAGDFVAGPSHVLPTGGAAAMFAGLTVDDFLRRTSFMAFTRKDLEQTLPVIEAFARVEGLDAHGRSAQIRFER
jgi:histidinol dehydrogenase